MCLIASDRSDKQIALLLGMSKHTIRSHVDRMFRRHGFTAAPLPLRSGYATSTGSTFRNSLNPQGVELVCRDPLKN